MNTSNTPIGPLDLWASAVSHAKQLSLRTGEAALVYHRAQDGRWFVLTPYCTAEEGQTIRTVVHSRTMPQYRGERSRVGQA